MEAVPIGALADENIHRRHRCGITDNREHGTPQIPTNPDAVMLASLLYLQDNHGSPEHMPCIEELHSHTRYRFEPFTVVHPLKELATIDRILLGVERSIAIHHGEGTVLGEECLILLLEVSPILQHHRCKIFGGIRTKHRATVATLPEHRDTSHMIHVCMGEDHRIDFARVE